VVKRSIQILSLIDLSVSHVLHHACRIFERILKTHIVHHLDILGLISTHQHGFRKNRSTVSQLLECFNAWTSSLDAREAIDVFYLDISKAFDTVSHPKLLRKLELYGIKGKTLKWIKSFLTGRKQAVRVNGVLSDYSDVCSGVPQGSVLGPILFLIYINDLVDVCKFSSLKMFADDSKLYFKCEDDSDYLRLLGDVRRVFNWMEENQLKVAVEKCAVLHMGSQNPSRNYSAASQIIPTANFMRDLGVIVTDDLKFSMHCTSVAQKAFNMTNLFFRAFKCRDRDFLTSFFTIYIRPLVEYATPVWSPHLQKDILLIEKVQRKFTKRIPGFFNHSYANRRNELKLDTLELRRLHSDLIFCYKMINGLVDVNADDFVTMSHNSHLRGHSQKLVVPKSRLDCRKYSFSNRVVPIWNALPQGVIESNTLSGFKQGISAVDFSKFLRFRD
jgi:hypothetical protein